MVKPISDQSSVQSITKANDNYFAHLKKQRKAKWVSLALFTIVAVGAILALHIGLHTGIHNLDFYATAGLEGVALLGVSIYAVSYLVHRILKHRNIRRLDPDKVYNGLLTAKTQEKVNSVIADLNRTAYRRFLTSLEKRDHVETSIMRGVLSNRSRLIRNADLSTKLKGTFTEHLSESAREQLETLEKLNLQELLVSIDTTKIDPDKAIQISFSISQEDQMIANHGYHIPPEQVKQLVSIINNLKEMNLSPNSLKGKLNIISNLVPLLGWS